MQAHRRSQEGPCPPPKFSEHLVILYFKRRFPKQKSIICLKSKHFGPPQIFLAPPKFLGWLRYCAGPKYFDKLKPELGLKSPARLITLHHVKNFILRVLHT